MSLNPLNPAVPPAGAGDPYEALYARLAAAERELEALKRREAIIIVGTRSDLATGIGPRARFGLLSDGTYGAERWTSAGVRTVATFA